MSNNSVHGSIKSGSTVICRYPSNVWYWASDVALRDSLGLVVDVARAGV